VLCERAGFGHGRQVRGNGLAGSVPVKGGPGDGKNPGLFARSIGSRIKLPTAPQLAWSSATSWSQRVGAQVVPPVPRSSSQGGAGSDAI